jgi:membrane protease YdiL (CAAX protease family)
MDDSTTRQGRLGELLRTNALAIPVEIVVVFLPLYLSVFISDMLGSDHVPLGGNVVLLQGPLVHLGMLISLLLLWVASRLRGARWGDFGVARPKSWFRTVLMSLGVALAVLGAVVMVINRIIAALPNLAPRDMSMYGYLAGNLPNLIINVVAMWFTAGFLEEFLWRGYLMNRLVDALGRRTKLAWAISLVGSAVVFGLIHLFQGPIGMIRTGAIGLVFGLCYLAVGRNLWPLVIAHALIDTLDFVTHYLGG